MNVDGRVSSGGLGGPAILPQALAMMSQMTRAFPTGSFSGIGGISDFGHALNYFMLGCGTVQVCTAAMLDHAVGPNVIKRLLDGSCAFFDKHADRGWKTFDDIRGLARDRVVSHAQIRRPESADYRGDMSRKDMPSSEILFRHGSGGGAAMAARCPRALNQQRPRPERGAKSAFAKATARPRRSSESVGGSPRESERGWGPASAEKC